MVIVGRCQVQPKLEPGPGPGPGNRRGTNCYFLAWLGEAETRAERSLSNRFSPHRCEARLMAMQCKCSCQRGAHQTVEGVVEEGDRVGEVRAAVRGEYPPAMCGKLAGIILRRP